MTITGILKHGRENAIRAEILAVKLETTPRDCAVKSCWRESRAKLSCMPPAAMVAISCRAMTQRLHSGKWRRSTVFRPPDANTVSPLLPR